MKINTYKLYSNIFAILIITFYLFPVKFNFLPITTSRIIMSFALLFTVLFKKNFLNKFQVISINTILTICFLTLSINGNIDLVFPWNFIEILLFYPCVSYLLYRILRERYRNIIVLIYVSLVVQSFLMYMMAFYPDAKSLYLSLLDSHLPLNYYPHRHIGLTGFSSYNMGIFLNLALPITIIIKHKFNPNIGFKLILNLSCVFILLISLFVSRSGFITLVFFYISIYLTSRLREKFMFIMYLGITSIILYFSIDYLTYAKEFGPAIEWTFTPLLEVIDGNLPHGFRVLFDQYWFPEEVKTFVIGDGRTTGKHGYYMHTDGGYMRLTLYFGLVGTIVSLFCLFTPLTTYLLHYPKNHRYYALFLTIFIVLFVIQYKGNIIIDGNECFKTFYLLILASFLENKNFQKIIPKCSLNG